MMSGNILDPFCDVNVAMDSAMRVEGHAWKILKQFPATPWRQLGARTLLGAPGIATRSKDATRGSWHRY